jgi:hypothetical protein
MHPQNQATAGRMVAGETAVETRDMFAFCRAHEEVPGDTDDRTTRARG